MTSRAVTKVGLRSLLRMAQKRLLRTYNHPALGRLTFRSGSWRGEFRHGDSLLSLSLTAAEGEPEAEMLQAAVGAVRGFDGFVAVARGFLAFQPAYEGAASPLKPVGISVRRPDPAWLQSRIRREATVPLRYARQVNVIWGLQFQVPGTRDVLEVSFFRGIPLFADCC